MNVALLGILALTLTSCSDKAQTANANQHAAPAIAAPTTLFDGDKSFEYLKKQVAFGPRVPGTPAQLACRDWIVEIAKLYAPSVELQPFSGHVGSKMVKMYNIIARFNPTAKKQVVICAHWDSRPTADEDEVYERRKKPITGANDGASGVAVLLELARVLHEKPVEIGVTLLFLDGEDVGPGIDNMLLGAKYWAKNQVPSKPEWAILLDMIGDADLRVPVEPYSRQQAPQLVDKVYKMADRLGLKDTFPYEESEMITDDHVPMNEAGVKTIDLIDFTYPYWHTQADTVDKCSPKSLYKVGTLVEAVLREEK